LKPERHGSFPPFCLLVNEQSDVVGIINVREGVLAKLDADFTTDMLHNEVHCSAEQGVSQDTSLPYTGGGH